MDEILHRLSMTATSGAGFRPSTLVPVTNGKCHAQIQEMPALNRDFMVMVAPFEY